MNAGAAGELAIRARIHEVDPTIAIPRLQPYTDLVSAEVSEERFGPARRAMRVDPMEALRSE